MNERDLTDTVAAVKAILDRVEARVERYAGTEFKIEQVLKETSDLRSELEQIRKTLHIGNGVPPVLQRLFLIESALDEIKAQAQRTNKERVAIIVALVTTLGSVASAFLAMKGGA